MNQSDQKHFNAMLKSLSQISHPRSKRLAYVVQSGRYGASAHSLPRIEGLIENLSYHEMRDVQKYIKDIRYTRDIFAELPLELSQRIARHLSIFQAIRARRVSKKWLDILSSSQTTQMLLSPWHKTNDSTIRIPNGLSLSAISSLEAEHVSIYRSGLAFDQRIIQQPVSRDGPLSNNVAYSNGIVAWIENNTSTLQVLSLEDDSGSSTFEDVGENLSHLALSSLMVAVITGTGECWIKEFANQAEHRFQLSSVEIEKVVAIKETLGVLHRPLAPNNMQVRVTTWTLINRNSSSFIAKLQRPFVQALRPCDLKMMLDVSGTFVIVFEWVTETKAAYFTRFSLEGQVLAQGTLALPDTNGFTEHSDESTITSSHAWTTVRSYSTFQTVGWSVNYQMLRVQYRRDCDLLRLTEDSFRTHLSPGETMTFSNNFFFWNDIAYCHADYPQEGTDLSILDFTQDFTQPNITFMGRDIHCAFDFSESEEEEFYNGGGHLNSLLLGDERFLVDACPFGLIIWAFDKNHGMTDIDEEYRLKSQKAREENWGLWRSYEIDDLVSDCE